MNNRVFINPKFNKMASTNLLPTNSKMHVNPNFTRCNMMQNNSRIYVNPHFIKSSVNLATSHNTYGHDKTSENECPLTSRLNSENMSLNTTSKSRYSLVRKTAIQFVPKATSVVGPTSASRTIKINKYKSIAISDFKKKYDSKESQSNTMANKGGQQLYINRNENLISPKPNQTIQYLGGQNCSKNIIRSRFKLRNVPFNSVRKASISSPFKTSVKRHLKKNNIPCPLFKKYGKCLRSVQGTCDFLHDKKHVSICRKFMKGICHDKGCLLSHEITSKKMPTCYFYLKGMCAKENCPYVHVKLNEKTKVCLEFLKGYCEKGEKCLNRHVICQSAYKNKGTKKIIRASKNKETNNKTAVNKYINIVTKDLNQIAQVTPRKDDTLNNICHTDKRYYKGQQTTDNIGQTSEIIKPTRCKLGTLPSFIRL